MHQNVFRSPLEGPVKRLWEEEVFPRCHDAVVFLDNAMAEALHWNGGASKLFESGAVAVREFSFFEHGSTSEPKALFLVSTPLTQQTLSTLSAIVRASVFTNVNVLTSCPPAAQILAKYGTAEASDSPQAFLDVEERLLDWMGNMTFVAEVMYVPLSVINVTPKFFLMPQFHDVFPPLQKQYNTSQVGATLEGASFTRSMQINVKWLISEKKHFPLDHCLELLEKNCPDSPGVTEGLQSLRCPFFCLIALWTWLDHLVLLASLSWTHWSEYSLHFLVIVWMCASTRAASPPHPSQLYLQMPCALKFCINSQQECMMELNRLLVESALKQGVRLDITGRLTAEQLRKRVLQFRKDGGDTIIDKGLIQQILGVAQAVLEGRYSKLEDLLSTEKVLVQNASVSSEAASRSLVQLLHSSNTTGLQLEDIIVLLAVLCSLYGGRTLGNESDRRTLKAEIVAAIYQAAGEGSLPACLEHFVSDELETLDESTVIHKVDGIFRALQSLGMARAQLRKYRSIIEEGNVVQPAVYKPLLKQVLQDIFDPSASAVPDLDHHSGGLSDIFKAGFG
ncbi:hypothetical protein V5799_025506 [Amblyomma americanum]|uniref:Sec1 family domain-containing protein 2 n=1 Tax=Amblyomma americanum TaxID=6943 RepID=A0AAQ4E9C1_AMBAM